MAARSDAATDRVSVASAPSTSTITVGGWVKIVNDRNDFSTFMRLYSAGGGTAITIGTKTDGTTPFVFSPLNSTGVAAAGMTVGTWTYIAYTLGAAGAVAIFAGTTPGSLTKTTGTVAANGTADHLALFGREPADGTEWLDGSIAYWRIWTAVLSDSEIAAESQSATPVRTSGLWASWAFAAAALTDGSGNGRNLAAGTTSLTSDTDPTLSTGVTGTGAATAPKAVAAGAGTVLATSAGAASAPPATAAGAGGVAVAGVGASTAPRTVAAGTGAAFVGGGGVATVPPATAGGLGVVAVTGSGAALAPPGVAAGVGGLVAAITGTGAALAPIPSAAGAGLVLVAGVGGAVAPAPVALGFESEVRPARRPRLTVQPNGAELAVSPNQAVLSALPNEARVSL